MRKSIKIPFSRQTYSEEYVPLSRNSEILISKSASETLSSNEKHNIAAKCRSSQYEAYATISDRFGFKFHRRHSWEDMQEQFVWMARMHSISKANAPCALSMVYNTDTHKPHGYIMEHLPGKRLEELQDDAYGRKLKRLIARAMKVINRYHLAGVPHGDFGSQNIIMDDRKTSVIDGRPWKGRIESLKRDDAFQFVKGVIDETALGKDELRGIVNQNANYEVAKVFIAEIDKA